MKKLKSIIAIALTVFVMLFTFGCKNNNNGNGLSDAEAVEKTNKTLKIHCFAYDTLNPLLNKNDTNMQMMSLMFESLIVCDNTQKAQTLLADSYSVSADGLTWTVNVKSGVKWHDGSDFTAYDVEKTYSDVLAYGESSPYFAVLQNLDYVSADSSKTVNFKLKSPQANFINLLEVPIVKYHSGESFTPTGTGPYVYKYMKNKIIYLTANEEWHKGKINIADIEVKILPDKETSVYAYVSKEIDIVSVTSSDDWGEYTSNSDNVIVDYPSNNFNYISINTNTEPLSSRLFRSAIAFAIDKDKICSEVLLSHGSVANTCINSQWWMYDPEVTNYKFNQDKAMQIMDTIKDDMKITPVSLMVNSENADKCKTAELIKENLKECGIILNIEYVDWQAFAERVNTGNYQMYLGTVKYASDINPAYVISNPDERLLNLFSQLQSQTTEDGVRTKYSEIQRKIASDLQIIPLYFDMSSVMYNRRISGEYIPFRSNIFNGIENLKLGK